MLAQLSDPEVYRVAYENVRRRQRRRGDHTPLTAASLSVLELPPDGTALLERLAREVSTQYYAFGPVVERQLLRGGKLRKLQRASPLDDIVLGALARVLAQLLEPSLSPCLYSYREGRSALQALRALRAYLRAHRRARPDPRQRGLYVIRRDIAGYGDAIPTGPGSPLFRLLHEGLTRAGAAPSEQVMQWLRAAFRPPLVRGEWLEQPLIGVPTGSPLQPLACNLYLTPLDALCEAVPGAFYARFGDDILFAHPDLAVAREVCTRMDVLLCELGLRANAAKSCERYFNLPGRAREPPFQGCAHLEYLGVRVDFRGNFGLKRDKWRALLRDVRMRLARSASLLAGDREGQRLHGLVQVVEQALAADGPLAAAAAERLHRLVDDRVQLRELDYRLWRALAESCDGTTDVRAFRRLPPRRLREAGLSSLVARRNRTAVARGRGAS